MPQIASPNALTTVYPLQIPFKDNSYRQSPILDLATIYDRLVIKCHASNRLIDEGYILPSKLSQKKHKDRIAPYPSYFEPKRKAIALDCEMAGVRNGNDEIISICAIDFFTGQVLINSLVEPHEPILEWRTDIHGIGPATLAIAASQGQVLRGWEAARQELFKHINMQTILVGQSLYHDLKVLRISHEKIFDTAIHTAEMVFGTDAAFGRRWSLQSLCVDLLGLRIRQNSSTHEALEDTMAAREVALWCLSYPGGLEQWAKIAREKYVAEGLKRAKARQQKKRNLRRSPRVWDGHNDDCGCHYHYRYGGDEVLRWEDVIDWETWPKSP
ncbi:hypothetical protein HYE67_001388 [Fusarium culmorum]|uniref:Exonuclease domain-containing protein n=1 Tax=Fusarium culmorum TaxID=5516 RepID=A0A2T4GVX0_FUSCU|nr:hypothetical protein FCULG_00005524 [Fusarium culmorum]QPC59157.1 hypothetical protein HYE67_001388 [Fusarium culmorum]